MRLFEALLEYVAVDQEKFERRARADNSYAQYKDKIGDDFSAWLEQFDPTQKKKYVNWMINKYMKGQIKRLEDIPSRIAPALDTYDRLSRTKRLKPDDKDINRITDIESVVQSYSDESDDSAGDEAPQSKKEKSKNIEQQMYDNGDAELIHNSSRYKVVIPHSHKASCYFGKNTKWCTTSDDSPGMHDQYAKQGPLYIILDKPNNNRWQFHFESGQFMDEEDEQINLEDFFENHNEILQVLLDRGVGTQVSDDIKLIGKSIVRNNKLTPVHTALDKLVEHEPQTASKVIKTICSDEGIDVDGDIVKTPRENDYAFILKKYADIYSLAQDMPRSQRGHMGVADALEMSDNFETIIGLEDVERFLEDHADSTVMKHIKDAIAEVPRSDIEEYIEDSVDEYEELSSEDMGRVLEEHEPFLDLYTTLIHAIEAGYQAGIKTAIDDSLETAFYHRMEADGITVLFFNDGTPTFNFHHDKPCAAVMGVDEFADVLAESSDLPGESVLAGAFYDYWSSQLWFNVFDKTDFMLDSMDEYDEIENFDAAVANKQIRDEVL